MTPPFNPNDVVEGKASGKLFRVKKCIFVGSGYGVLFYGVHCNHPDGFNPNAYVPIAGLGDDGFDFRQLMGARA